MKQNGLEEGQKKLLQQENWCSLDVLFEMVL